MADLSAGKVTEIIMLKNITQSQLLKIFKEHVAKANLKSPHPNILTPLAVSVSPPVSQLVITLLSLAQCTVSWLPLKIRVRSQHLATLLWIDLNNGLCSVSTEINVWTGLLMWPQTTKAGPLCDALLSNTDVKAHTVEYVTGNQCSLIGTET